MKLFAPCNLRISSLRFAAGRSAFTLTELLISIAIALILMLGVNQIFKASSATVGAGQALSTATRDSRVVQNAFAADFRSFVSEGIFLLRSEQRVAFRNSTDRLGDADGDPATIDLPGNTVNVSPFSVNSRGHRLDRIGFFARGDYARQTGGINSANLTSLMRSNEAWIWYGHLAVPAQWLKNSGGVYDPYNPLSTLPGNDNNGLASDLVLGRVATLLVAGTNPDPARDPWFEATGPLDPLIYSSRIQSDIRRLCDTPLDIAHTNISNYIRGLLSATTPPDWYDLMLGYDYRKLGTDGVRQGEYYRAGSPYLPSAAPNSNTPRFTAWGSNLTAFCMVRGCTQFIVEYAGSYLDQDDNPASPTYGEVQSVNPPKASHKIDFIVDRGLNGHATAGNPPLSPTRIRWYGYPRHTNGFDSNGNPTIDYRDVIPLRDLWPAAVAPAPFERIDNNDDSHVNSFPAKPGPDPLITSNFNYLSPTSLGTLKSGPRAYVCAWNPTQTAFLPKMVRITIAIDDPNGRLGDAQTFEYIFNLQQ